VDPRVGLDVYEKSRLRGLDLNKRMLSLVTINVKKIRIFINCVYFWVFPQRLVYIGRRFGPLCQVHLQTVK
jgi:hypothetical protein